MAENEVAERLGFQDGDQIDYDDAVKLRELLVGQYIVDITKTTGQALYDANYKGVDYYYYGGRGEYDDVLEYHLSGGLVLRAHAHDGGCGCTNGCFSVDIEEQTKARLIGATILNVTVEEEVYSEEESQTIVDGQGQAPRDGSSTIDVFVYVPGLQGEERLSLVKSAGGDNGYYGWGFHFSVSHPVLRVAESPRLPHALEGVTRALEEREN